jgi:phosphoadenosine phosphosulfate reductase
MAEYDVKFGLIKFNPIVSWTSEEVWNYIKKHKLIYNPLHDHNYPSIGCFPCTKKVAEGDDPRSGRWADQDKTECGLHK